MKPLVFLLKVSILALVVQAKHDGEIPDDDDDDSSSVVSTSTSSTLSSSQLSTTVSTVLSTSVLTSTSGSPTSSTTMAPTAIPSGALKISPPGNITTCAPAIFTWEFDASTSVPLTIVVTNERAVSTQSGSPNQAPLVERTLSTTVDARTCVVSWQQANVPAGAYTLFATDSAHTGTISAQSSLFFVSSGSDTSCLNQTSTASTSTTAASASDTTNGDGNPNDTTEPSASSKIPKPMSMGAIAGTIAGILVGVVGLLIVFSLPRLRRRILRSKAPQRPGGPYILF